MLATCLFALYLMCIFTVCMMTFRKGYTLLGILGIFLPFLWLIGAVLPAKKGSRYQVQQEMQFQEDLARMTR
jgi:hypothetical protein